MSKHPRTKRAKSLDAPTAYVTLSSNDLDRWAAIEVELANLSNAAQAVQHVGEARWSDGTDRTAAFRFLSVGLAARIDILKGLLGLLGEKRS